VSPWNMFSEEVRKARQNVRDYGFDERSGQFWITNSVKTGDSYKAQAIRELALRLEFAELLKEKTREIGRLIDENEKLTTDLELSRNLERICPHETDT
jgi:hypothetical protein